MALRGACGSVPAARRRHALPQGQPVFHTGRGVMHPRLARLRFRAAPPFKGSAPRDVRPRSPDVTRLPCCTRSRLRFARKTPRSAARCARASGGRGKLRRNSAAEPEDAVA